MKKSCNMCGRKLKTDKSVSLGYGPVCFKKISWIKKQEVITRRRFTMTNNTTEEYIEFNNPNQLNLEL